jgi:acetyl esterase/lipase
MLLVAAVLAGSFAAGAPARAEGVRYLDDVFTDVAVTRDVRFGEATNSRGEVEQLLLDIYEPAGDTAMDRGLLIWAHGSGFRFGEKEQAGPSADYARKGWVAMSIGYRKRPELPPNAIVGILTNPTSIPTAQAAARDAQHDLQAAVRWARANAADLGVDPDRIAVGGISAGGIIALMAAFNPDDPGDSGTPGVSSEVAAAVSHAGAYVPGLQGGMPAPGAAPVAMYHGTSDEQVPYPTSPPGCVITILMGNTCEYVTFVGREHATLGVDLAQDFLYRSVIRGDDHLHAPTKVAVDDEVTAVGGAEHLVGNLGVTSGVVIPTDPNVAIEHTSDMIRYFLEGIGIPIRLFG